MRNYICLVTLYAFTYILYSCSMEQEYNSFNIIYCKEVSSGLQCNNSCGTIEYRGEKYTIKKSAYYVKKKLQNVDVYRSDGIYNIEDDSYTLKGAEFDLPTIIGNNQSFWNYLQKEKIKYVQIYSIFMTFYSPHWNRVPIDSQCINRTQNHPISSFYIRPK